MCENFRFVHNKYCDGLHIRGHTDMGASKTGSTRASRARKCAAACENKTINGKSVKNFFVYEGSWDGGLGKCYCSSKETSCASECTKAKSSSSNYRTYSLGSFEQLKTDIQTANTNYNTCNNSLGTITGERDSCNADLDKMTTAKTNCDSNLSTIRTAKTKCNSNLSTIRTAKTKCDSNLRTMTSAKNTCDSNLGTITGERNSCKTNLRTITGERNLCKTNLNAMTGERNSCKTNLNAMTTAKNTCESTKLKSEEECTKYKSELSNTIQACESREAKLKGNVASLGSDIHTKDQTILSLNNQIQTAESTVQTYKDSLNAMTGERNSCKTNLGKMTNKRNKWETKHNKLSETSSNRIAELRRKRNRLKSDYNTLSKKHTTLQNDKVKCDSDLSTAQESNAGLEGQNEELKRQLGEKSKSLNTASEDLEDLTSKFTNASESAESWKTQFNELQKSTDNQIADINNKHLELSKQHETLTTKNTQLNEDHTTLQTQHRELNTAKQRCDTDLTKEQATTTTLRAERDTCKTNLGTMTGERNLCKTNLGTITAAKNKCDTDLGTITAAKNKCDTDLTQEKAATTTLSDERDTCNNNLVTMTTNRDNWEKKYNDCNADLGEMTKAKNTCDSDLSTMTTDKNKCDTDLTQEKAATTTLRAEKAKLVEENSSLQTKVNDLKAKIDDLELRPLLKSCMDAKEKYEIIKGQSLYEMEAAARKVFWERRLPCTEFWLHPDTLHTLGGSQKWNYNVPRHRGCKKKVFDIARDMKNITDTTEETSSTWQNAWGEQYGKIQSEMAALQNPDEIKVSGDGELAKQVLACKGDLTRLRKEILHPYKWGNAHSVAADKCEQLRRDLVKKEEGLAVEHPSSMTVRDWEKKCPSSEKTQGKGALKAKFVCDTTKATSPISELLEKHTEAMQRATTPDAMWCRKSFEKVDGKDIGVIVEELRVEGGDNDGNSLDRDFKAKIMKARELVKNEGRPRWIIKVAESGPIGFKQYTSHINPYNGRPLFNGAHPGWMQYVSGGNYNSKGNKLYREGIYESKWRGSKGKNRPRYR